MTCIIIEDEKIAAERLQNLILEYDDSIEILEVIQSIKKAVDWFNKNHSPDLVFLDIHLADGLSFEIFEQVIIDSPIIFTTAYEEYTLKAFKLNSIDYLLKPIDKGDLNKAIEKFRSSPYHKNKAQYSQEVFDKVLQSFTKDYKTKFVIKVGERIKVIPVQDIHCFFSMEKATFLQTNEKRDYAINYSLGQLEDLLDPKKFFRINRKYIISLSSIKDIISYSNSRLELKISDSMDDDFIVSREKVNEFKEWLEG